MSQKVDLLEEKSLIDKANQVIRAEKITAELEDFVQTITLHMSELQVCLSVV